MVDDGRMPPPREINKRRVWFRHQIGASFDELPGGVDQVGSHYLEQWATQRQADTEAMAELTELSKTPGAVVYYRGYMMDRRS